MVDLFVQLVDSSFVCLFVWSIDWLVGRSEFLDMLPRGTQALMIILALCGVGQLYDGSTNTVPGTYISVCFFRVALDMLDLHHAACR